MSILGKLIRSTIDIVSLPVEIVKDVVTLGNVGDTPYTVQRAKKLARHAKALLDEIDEGDET